MLKKSEPWREWMYLLMFAVTVAVITRTYLIAPIIVDGESMAPTLQDQDRMIVNKSSYWFSEPERFDIVVFHATEDKDYIKRVIGVPGDRLFYYEDQLYINGVKVNEPFLEPLRKEMNGTTITPDFTLKQTSGYDVIPEGHVFVLGDNRRHSLDSRMFGLIKTEDIVGRATFIFWPVSHLQWNP